MLSDRRFLLAVVWAAALMAFFRELRAYDIWFHLKSGELMLSTLRVPRTDPFSFTAAGRPWTHHQWLSCLLLYGTWSVAGAAGLMALRALAMGASLVIAWFLALRRGVGAGLASVLALAAALQLKVRALARPYIFSFIFFMVFVAVLEACMAGPSPDEPAIRPSGKRRRRAGRFPREDHFLWGGGGRLLLLPVLVLLWANMHAGFMVGLLLLGTYGVGEMVRLWIERDGRPYASVLLKEEQGARFRAMFVTGLCCTAASTVTPYGAGVLLYPFRLMLGVKLLEKVQEWRPVAFSPEFAVFWAVAGLGAIVLVRSALFARQGGRLRGRTAQIVTDALLFAGFCFLTIRSVRHLAWLLLLAPLIIGSHLNMSGRPGRPRRLYAWAACLLALVIGPGSLLVGEVQRVGVFQPPYPVEACDFIEREGLAERCYNSYEWGGYLIWRFWPSRKVFMDGRCLVYGDGLLRQYFDVATGKENWQDVLDRWDVRMFLVRYRKRDNRHFLSGERWRCVYWDDTALIGLRRDAPSGRELPELALSNPLRFDDSLSNAPTGRILEELELVLRRSPDCWTAWAFRARCLAKLARESPAERAVHLDSALRCAQRAVELGPTGYEAWLAMAEIARELGDERRAADAAARAEDCRPACQR